MSGIIANRIVFVADSSRLMSLWRVYEFIVFIEKTFFFLNVVYWNVVKDGVLNNDVQSGGRKNVDLGGG